MQSSGRVLAVANRKGGTGKSTTVVNLGAEFAARGQRVLIVDVDPQGHAGLGFGVQALPDDATVHQAFTGGWGASIIPGVRRTRDPLLDVLPANRNFDGNLKIHDPACLAKAIDPLRSRYDVILIDTPPASLSLIICALYAADAVIVPTALEHLSLDGVRQFALAYQRVVVGLGAALLGMVVLPTRVDMRSTMQRTVLDHLVRSFGSNQILTGIRVDTKVAEAFGRRQPLFQYERRARALVDFAALADALNWRFSISCDRVGTKADPVQAAARPLAPATFFP